MNNFVTVIASDWTAMMNGLLDNPFSSTSEVAAHVARFYDIVEPMLDAWYEDVADLGDCFSNPRLAEAARNEQWNVSTAAYNALYDVTH
jgi:hypothetical protein